MQKQLLTKNERGAIGTMFLALLTPVLVLAILVVYDIGESFAVRNMLRVVVDATLFGVGTEFRMRYDAASAGHMDFLEEGELESRLQSQLRYALATNEFTKSLKSANCTETGNTPYIATALDYTALEDEQKNKLSITCTVTRTNIGASVLSAIGLTSIASTDITVTGEYALFRGGNMATTSAFILDMSVPPEGAKAANLKTALKNQIDKLKAGDITFIIAANRSYNGGWNEIEGRWKRSIAMTITKVLPDDSADDTTGMPQLRTRASMKTLVDNLDFSDFTTSHSHMQGAIHMARKLIRFAQGHYQQISGISVNTPGASVLHILSDGLFSSSFRPDYEGSDLIVPVGDWYHPDSGTPCRLGPTTNGYSSCDVSIPRDPVTGGCLADQANNTGVYTGYQCFEYWNRYYNTPLPDYNAGQLGLTLHYDGHNDRTPLGCYEGPGGDSAVSMAVREADLARTSDGISLFGYMPTGNDMKYVNIMRRLVVDDELPACWNKEACSGTHLVPWKFTDEVTVSHCPGYLDSTDWNDNVPASRTNRLAIRTDYDATDEDLSANHGSAGGGYLIK